MRIGIRALPAGCYSTTVQFHFPPSTYPSTLRLHTFIVVKYRIPTRPPTAFNYLLPTKSHSEALVSITCTAWLALGLHKTLSRCSRHTRMPDPLKAEYQIGPLGTEQIQLLFSPLWRSTLFSILILLDNCNKLSIELSKAPGAFNS